MKFVYILVAIAIIAGGAYWFTMNRSVDEGIDGEEVGVTDESENPDEEVYPSDSQVFELVGSNFRFDVDEISVVEGDLVTIQLISEEGLHDWVVDEFDAATEQVPEGRVTSVTFVADKVGEFEYYCSVGNHRAQGMTGTLRVISQEEFGAQQVGLDEEDSFINTENE